jgi:hypothetical protein
VSPATVPDAVDPDEPELEVVLELEEPDEADDPADDEPLEVPLPVPLVPAAWTCDDEVLESVEVW